MLESPFVHQESGGTRACACQSAPARCDFPPCPQRPFFSGLARVAVARARRSPYNGRVPRRLVVKIGTSVLSGGPGRLDLGALGRLAGDVCALRRRGAEVVVVSSGAILAGWQRLGLRERPRTTVAKQATAAVGQSRLMRAWEAAFARRGAAVAQILLTRDDLRERHRYLNARNTLFELLRLGVVPIINENDTVAVDEIKFGDNDGISALVAGLADADRLVLLTDQEGLFDADPRREPSARLILRVGPGEAVGRTGRAGPLGSGGMASKVNAARTAASAGIETVIANGARAGLLLGLEDGSAAGTRFEPKARPLDKRRQWLAFASRPRGTIVVDDGARAALVERSKSLLPSGVRDVKDRFEAGDVVSLVCRGAAFARGLTNYGAEELDRIRGLKTSEIEATLGHKPADEVVHRDNLVLLE
ncbi:MAG: glutamate 5-kinase [Elusimicrobia bacterium]|nr:glutamate 5-kinase [Elusimicrobiota bacterium]